MWRGWLGLLMVTLVANGVIPWMQPCACRHQDAPRECCARTAMMQAGCSGQMPDLKATVPVAERNVLAASRALTRTEVTVDSSEGRDCGAGFVSPSPGVHEPTIILRT